VAKTSIDSVPALGTPELLILVRFVRELIALEADAFGRVNDWLHIVDLLNYYAVLDVTGSHCF